MLATKIMAFSCNYPFYATCHITENIKVRIHGNSLREALNDKDIDESFLLYFETESMFKSRTGERIIYNGQSWIIESKYHQPLLLLDSNSLPFGLKNWTHGNSTVTLNLNACNNSEFGCNNGICLQEWNLI